MFDNLSEKFSDAFKNISGQGKITESNIDDSIKIIKTALLEADVNFKVVKSFIAGVKEKALGEKVIRGVNPEEQFTKIVHDELCLVMGSANEELDLNRAGPIPVLVVGLNGQGKTTFSGKLSLHLKSKKSKNVLLVPADTFRPAAKAQLKTLADGLEVECFDSNLSMHPKDIVQAAMTYAQEKNIDVVIIDTAGRLHVDDQLMNELVDVKKSLEAYKPEVLMVADAMTGQEAVNVSKTFHDKITLTGIVLSKMDSDAKGGAALSIRHVTGVPIKYVSVGEKMKDLELFHPDRLAGRILDMGDIVSLVEKAEEAIDEKDAEKMMKRLEKGQFTVDDFMQQMDMMKNLGSMSSILKMIPGMGGMLRQVGDLSTAEDEMKNIRVIINSMTKAERQNYKLLNESRVKRIALGSGRGVSAVQAFIKKFKQMESMMGGMMKMFKGGGMPALPGMGGGIPDMSSGMPDFSGIENQFGGKKKKKGKKKGPWGGGYFK